MFCKGKIKMNLSEKKLFLFDIDGTLSVGNTLFDGSMDLLNYINSVGGRAYYITNNSTNSTDSYIEKFARWNIKTTANLFVTAGYVSMLYLKEHFPDEKVFVLGTKSYVKELKKNALNITETPDDDVKCVLVAFDNELTYKKTEYACELLSTNNIPYLATNPDLCCPAPFGFIPDCGSICSMIDNCVGRTPEYLGKPNKILVDMCLADSGFTKEQTLVVGDRLYTDIACGINGGTDTCAVLTGETTREEIASSQYKPTYTFENVRELLNACKQ